MPGADEPLHGRVVVRAERPVRLDSLCAKRRDRPGRRPGCRGTRRAAARRSRASDGARAGERRVGRDDQHVRVAQQLDRLERRVADRQQRRSRRRARPRSTAPTISSSSSSSSITSICGHCSVKRRISSGSTRAPTDWNVPTRERARLAGLQRAEVGLGRLQARDDRLGVPQQQRAGLGQRDRRAGRPGARRAARRRSARASRSAG